MAGVLIAACLKQVDRRPEVDALSGVPRGDADPRFSGVSDADRAALELALRLGETWGAEVLAVAAGPAATDTVLRDALAAGATRAVRVDVPAGLPSDAVAAALAPVLTGAALVCCGDYSPDRGSGSVPGFLAARLGAAQALGCIAVEPDPAAAGSLTLVRRLDGGRRERLAVTAPAVVSVEGSVARLRRAPLAAALRARTATVEVRSAPRGLPAAHGASTLRPYRPRARALPPPTGDDVRHRLLSLTAALSDREPPQVVHATPDEAAERILAALRQWGELPA
jgi:electron transfer flavoprotein beta subunit